jgi:hypothetical protein
MRIAVKLSTDGSIARAGKSYLFPLSAVNCSISRDELLGSTTRDQPTKSVMQLPLLYCISLSKILADFE